jgi:hypothetical protein
MEHELRTLTIGFDARVLLIVTTAVSSVLKLVEHGRPTSQRREVESQSRTSHSQSGF